MLSPELEKRLLEVATNADACLAVLPLRGDRVRTIAEALRPLLTEFYNAGLEAAAGVCGEPHGTGVCSCDVCETVRKRARAIRALKENP